MEPTDKAGQNSQEIPTNETSEAKGRVVYFDSTFIETLKANTVMSPHTVLCLNNPLHAYLCTGEDCRRRVNGQG